MKHPKVISDRRVEVAQSSLFILKNLGHNYAYTTIPKLSLTVGSGLWHDYAHNMEADPSRRPEHREQTRREAKKAKAKSKTQIKFKEARILRYILRR